MPTILDRITSLWRQRSEPERAIIGNVPTAASATQPASVSFTAQRDRRSVINDCRDMVRDDPRAKQALATLARDATAGGFDLQITGPRSAQAQAAADALFARVNLLSRLDDWARLTFRDGDTFLELGVMANGEIAQVTRKPTLEMFRNSDEFDRLADPAQAFYWTTHPTYTDRPSGDATYFPEWQIVHARWDRDDGSRYGTPMLASARKAYKRMTQGELDIAIRRKTRAGMRYVHVLDGASPAEIEAYKAANRPALDDPYAAVADFFFNKAGGLQALQGDARLSDIDDVVHHVDTFGIASPVPLELIGYGRNLNRDVLEQKKAQYDETLGSVRGWLVGEFIMPLLVRQWLFLGIWPDDLEIDVQWKAKKQASAVELKDMAAFGAAVKAGRLLTAGTLLRIMATKLPDFDVDAELLALQAEDEAAERQAAAQALEMQRVAANAAADGEDEEDADQEGDE
jgi:hypothetical protein